MKLVSHGGGKFSCLACNVRMIPVRKRGQRGIRRCPGCGFVVHLPRMRKGETWEGTPLFPRKGR